LRPLWLQRHRVVQAEALRALSQRSLLQYRSSKGALARAPEGVQGSAVAAACRRIAVLTNSTSRAALMKIVYFCRLPVAIRSRRYCSTPSQHTFCPPSFHPIQCVRHLSGSQPRVSVPKPQLRLYHCAARVAIMSQSQAFTRNFMRIYARTCVIYIYVRLLSSVLTLAGAGKFFLIKV
jgi:hypothetical protein